VPTVDEYIELVSTEARHLVAGRGRAYDAGKRLWTLGVEHAATEDLRSISWPLWLIWGSLTDWVDGPRGREPGAETAASEAMRRAASEWLAVAKDEPARTAYFARWVYEECGYERGPDSEAR
jgi:hypothetical protein